MSCLRSWRMRGVPGAEAASGGCRAGNCHYLLPAAIGSSSALGRARREPGCRRCCNDTPGAPTMGVRGIGAPLAPDGSERISDEAHLAGLCLIIAPRLCLRAAPSGEPGRRARAGRRPRPGTACASAVPAGQGAPGASGEPLLPSLLPSLCTLPAQPSPLGPPGSCSWRALQRSENTSKCLPAASADAAGSSAAGTSGKAAPAAAGPALSASPGSRAGHPAPALRCCGTGGGTARQTVLDSGE